MTHPIYQSYSEALNASITQEGYCNRLLANVVSAKTTQFRNKLRNEKQLDLGALRTSIFLSAISNRRQEHLNIIDFGGACGYHYYICKALLPSQPFDWRVLETESMATIASKDHGCNELSFYIDLCQATQGNWLPTAVIASSSLQYHDQPLSALQRLLALKAEVVFITRTPLSMLNSSIIMTQKSQLADNGPGPLPDGFDNELLEYPITYIPRDEILKLATFYGYELRLSLLEEKETLLYEGKPINRHESLLFVCPSASC